MKTKSEVLAKLVNKSGVQKTLDITGYGILELFMALEDKVKIDSEVALDLLFELRGNTNLLHDRIGHAKLRFDTYEQLIYWRLTPPYENMEAMGTPFWGGETIIPIDTTEYNYLDKNNKSQTIYDEYNHTIELDDLEPFNSVSELVNWFNNSYLNEVYEILLGYLEEYRREYKYTD